jgi:hypothetical protein
MVASKYCCLDLGKTKVKWYRKSWVDKKKENYLLPNCSPNHLGTIAKSHTNGMPFVNVVIDRNHYTSQKWRFKMDNRWKLLDDYYPEAKIF